MKLGAIHRPTPPNRIRAGLAALSGYKARATVDYMEGLTFDGRNPLGNDTLENCVPCAFLRLAQARWKRISGDDIDPQRAWAVGLYSAWTGYMPDTPDSDKGADVLDAMAQWGRLGIYVRPGLMDIGPWFAVPVLSQARVRAAIDIGVGCLLTLQLFEGDIDTSLWGIVASGAAELGAHEVTALAYDPESISVITWGRVVRIDILGLADRLLAVQVPLSRLVTDAAGLSGNGETWAQLIADMGTIDVV